MVSSRAIGPSISPPQTQQDAFDWLRLIRSAQVGPVTFQKLLAEYQSAAAALSALPGIASTAGVEKYAIAPEHEIRDEIRQANVLGARLLFMGSEAYPSQLLDLTDPPPALWALGNLDLLARPMVALVGARNASAVGLRMAEELAGALGELGYVIVSGLARGIDGAAHRASLKTGTIAVQAGGIDTVYPKEHAELTLDIAQKGLRLSEAPIGLAPKSRHFPRRNRIISGLSQAVVVVEGAARSGSLITARGALDQGRDVMAVPGSPLDPRASGCNILIREGALLVRSADDIHDALSKPNIAQQMCRRTDIEPDTEEPCPPQDENLSHSLLGLLSPTPITEDELIRKTGVPATQVMSALAVLDLSGEIVRQPGGKVARVTV